jgi:hypothetical protein
MMTCEVCGIEVEKPPNLCNLHLRERIAARLRGGQIDPLLLDVVNRKRVSRGKEVLTVGEMADRLDRPDPSSS